MNSYIKNEIITKILSTNINEKASSINGIVTSFIKQLKMKTMNTTNKNLTARERSQSAINMHMVFQKVNANLKSEDRLKGRNRNGGYVSWPKSKNNAFQYEASKQQN